MFAPHKGRLTAAGKATDRHFPAGFCSGLSPDSLFISPKGEPITAANLSKIFEMTNYYEESFLNQCFDYSHLFIIFAASNMIM